MTRFLEAAVAKLERLAPADQDRIAQWLLDELRDDEKWTERLQSSQSVLSELADEARAEHRAGRATDLDPDQL